MRCRPTTDPRILFSRWIVGWIAVFITWGVDPVYPTDPGSSDLVIGSSRAGLQLPGYATAGVELLPPSDETSQDGRHLGLGDPLVGTSWLNRPLYAGWMFGGMWGDELIQGRIDQDEEIFGGYRLGWDFDSFWGIEGRFAFGHIDFKDQVDVSVDRTCEHQYWDLSLLYYPWGDSRWRPYASVGAGLVSLDLRDSADQDLGETLFTVPVGTGVKYFWKNWLALRVSVTDNLAVENGPFDTMHNLSLTGDVEIRFGGQRTSYFPYHGSIHLW